MRNYSDLNPQEQIHYASAAQLTSIHYLYPLMLQDLTGTEDLEQKYLRVISKVQLSYKSPYGLKANLKKLSQAINEQKPKRDYFTLPSDHPLETIESVLNKKNPVLQAAEFSITPQLPRLKMSRPFDSSGKTMTNGGLITPWSPAP